jgi:PAS domain S-box-containing protein
MPNQNGIEFLRSVREIYPDLPFILFTGKGSEEVASEAISAGVSDYLQKESGTDQYTVLANRIANLVSQYRAVSAVEEYASEREESERYRQRFIEIISAPRVSDTAKIDGLLALGCERLDVENGHLVMINEATNRHEVVSVFGSEVVREGVTDLSETYCRQTIESDGILDVYHAGEQGWTGDPAYEAFGLECYIGGKLTGEGRLFGTLCFVDPEPREPFTTNEKAFFDLLVQWFSQMLERRRRLNQADVIFEHVQDAIFLIDVADEETFTISSVNRAYEELTEYSSAELQGQTPRDLLGDDQGAEVESRFRECIEKREPIEYDEQLTIGDSTKHWHTRLAPVIEDGRVMELVGATRDITAQRQRQQELEAERRFISQVLDTLDDVFYVVGPNWDLERWNKRAEEATGYSEMEIEAMDALDATIGTYFG